ncbi:MAG: hypothetical protein NTX63_03715 [Candidatus Peregrinibacteria bacterium]|nr:hypothetical protein [Candidatus Peregrinibacteria bacterium]
MSKKNGKEVGRDRDMPNLEKWFGTGVNPLVAINNQYSTPTGLGDAKSVGVVVEQFKGKINLVMTCRHAFLDLHASSQIILGHKSHNGIGILRQESDAMYDREKDLDLAFFLAVDEQGTQKRLLRIPEEDLAMPANGIMFNAKNESSTWRHTYNVQLRRNVEVKERSIYSYFSTRDAGAEVVLHSDLSRQTELEATGLHRHRVLQMQSRPGCSGSPVFSERGILYGINLRGTVPGDGRHEHCGDELVLLPVSAIVETRKRIDAYIQDALKNI